MADDSPRTIRRKSLTRREMSGSEEEPLLVSASEFEEFLGFTEKLNQRISKSFGKSLQSFRVKLTGAGDASYPRSLVIQQIKQSAMSLYTASELICKDVCDVADDSPLILLCFSIGLQALMQETLRILNLNVPQEDVNRIVEDVVNDLRTTKASQVSFREVDIESHVDHLATSFGLRNEPSERPQQPMAEERQVSPPRTQKVNQRSVSPERPVTPPRPRTPLRSLSPMEKTAEMLEQRMTAVLPASPARARTPERVLSPMEKTNALLEEKMSARSKTPEKSVSPPRQLSPPKPGAGNDLFATLLRSLRSVTVSNYDPKTFKKAQQAVREVTNQLWLAIDVLNETRVNQRFSQSQLI